MPGSYGLTDGNSGTLVGPQALIVIIRTYTGGSEGNNLAVP